MQINEINGYNVMNKMPNMIKFGIQYTTSLIFTICQLMCSLFPLILSPHFKSIRNNKQNILYTLLEC